MSIKSYLKRGLKYTLTGVPQKVIKVNNVCLGPTELLIGKTALITGGTSGIGKAIAKAFLNAGATVIITSRTEARAKEAVVDIIELKNQEHSIVYGVELDTENVESFDKKIKEILALPNVEKIDILVNNAGVNSNGSFNCSEESYTTIMNTNLKGYFFLARCIGEYMVKEGIQGNILNISSASSIRPAIGPYMLSKWGVRGLTMGLAKRYITHNIVVNGLAPGPTATPMLKKTEHCDDITLLHNPSSRYALPEEIANMAVVLTSSLGRLIVGDTIFMTGGAGVITYDDIKY